MDNKSVRKFRWKSRLGRVVLVTFSVLFALVLLINTFLQTARVQNFMAHQVSKILTEELGIEVTIDKLYLSLMMRLRAEGVVMKDFHHNDMVRAKKVTANIDGIDIPSLRFSLSHFRMENSGFVLRKYKGEPKYNISMIFPHDPADTSVFYFPATILCGDAHLRNCFFHLINETKPARNSAFDYNNIYLDIKSLDADKVLISDEEYSFRVQQLTVVDTSGFAVEEMTTWMRFMPDGWYMDDLKVKTSYSNLDLDLVFAYSTFDNLTEFVDSVQMISTIRPSVLDIRDIAYFAKSLEDYRLVLKMQGQVDGSVAQLGIPQLSLQFGDASNIDLSAYLEGIEQPETALMDIQIQQMHTTLPDLQSLETMIGTLKIPAGIIDTAELSGHFKGTVDDFETTVAATATFGNVSGRLKMWKVAELGDYQYYGILQGADWHSDPHLDDETMYRLKSMLLSFEGYGTTIDNAQMKIYGELDRIEAFEYQYDTLRINGTLSKKMFEGNVDLNDQCVDFHFNGLVTIDEESPEFNFKASIKDAYLSRLGLAPERSEDLKFSANVSAKLKGEDFEHLLGLLSFTDVELEENGTFYDFDDIKIGTYQQFLGQRKIVVRSSLLDLNFEGDFELFELDQVFPYFLSMYVPSYDRLMQQDTTEDFGKKYNMTWDVTLKDISPLTNWLLPELSIPEGLTLRGMLNLEDSIFSIDGQAKTIDYAGFEGKNWFFTNQSDNEHVQLHTGFEKFYIFPPDEYDSVGMVRDSLHLTLELYRDTVEYHIEWQKDCIAKHRSFLHGFCDLSHYPETNFAINDMKINILNGCWTVNQGHSIKIDSTENVMIRQLHFFSDTAYIKLDGDLLNDSTAMKMVNFSAKNLNLNISDYLLNRFGFDFNGSLSAQIEMAYSLQHFSLFSDIAIDQMTVNQVPLGDLSLVSNYLPDRKSIAIDAQSTLINRHGKAAHPLQLNGTINTDNSDDRMNLSLKINDLTADIFEPFVNEFVEKMSGTMTLDGQLTGSFEHPNYTANIAMNNCEALVKYTNVPYICNGFIILDNKNIDFNQLIINDKEGGEATVEGGIHHQDFGDMVLEMNIRPDKLKFLNTNRLQSDIFYGNAVVTGGVRISGPMNNIDISAFVQTNTGTDIAIPISSAMSVEENTYIIFKEPENDTIVRNKMQSEVMGLTLTLRMLMTPEGQVRLSLPGDVGNLTAHGNGLITLGLDKQGHLSLAGTYVLDGGRFHLNLKNFFSKKFEISNGSSITFNGDPLDASLDVRAIYSTRTTLSGLVTQIDTTQMQQRTNVNCILRLNGELADPRVSFSFDFPDQSEEFKQTIFGQIDTTNEALMTKQAFSLLVINSFSGNLSGSTLGSTITNSGIDVITNQISGWLSQITKNVNIGFNYRPGDDITTDEIGLALSTQLFNNRVTIDANVGYSGNNPQLAGRNNANVVGDATIEIKITKDGRFTTKVFTRSNANDFSKIGTVSEQGYTYGIGLNYRKNFNKFSEMFRRTEEQKQQRALKKEQRKAEKEQKKKN